MTTRLSLYNAALRHLGSRELASLSENRESRRVLDGVWNSGLVNTLLETGLWNFAIRAVRLEYTPSIAPDFGYARAFAKPDDFVRTAAVCSEEFFNLPLTQYADEAAYWFSDLDPLYVKYVSNDADYGGNLTQWPPGFTRWAETYLAHRVAKRLTGSDSAMADMLKLQDRLLIDAKSRDAMAEPTAFPPQGSWVRARSQRNGRWDRGSRSRLIG